MGLIDVEFLTDILVGKDDDPKEPKQTEYEAEVSYDFDNGWMAEFKLPEGEFETIDGHFDYDNEFDSMVNGDKPKRWAVGIALDYAKEHKPCKVTVYSKTGKTKNVIKVNQ